MTSGFASPDGPVPPGDPTAPPPLGVPGLPADPTASPASDSGTAQSSDSFVPPDYTTSAPGVAAPRPDAPASPPAVTPTPPAPAPVPPGYAPPPGYPAPQPPGYGYPPPGYGYPPPPGYPYVPPPRPVDRRVARGLVLTLLTVVLVLLGCLGLGVSLVVRAHNAINEQPAPPDPIVAPGAPVPSGLPTDSPPPGPTAPVPPGAPVRDGSFEFTVQKIECGKRTVGSSYLAATAKGQYCLVPLAARNVTAGKDFFVISYQKLVTTSGTAVDADIPAILGANDGHPVFLGQVEPGATTSGIMVFDIPKDATVAYLEVHGDTRSDGAKIKAG